MSIQRVANSIESAEKGQTKSFNISGNLINYDIDSAAVNHVDVYTASCIL